MHLLIEKAMSGLWWGAIKRGMLELIQVLIKQMVGSILDRSWVYHRTPSHKIRSKWLTAFFWTWNKWETQDSCWQTFGLIVLMLPFHFVIKGWWEGTEGRQMRQLTGYLFRWPAQLMITPCPYLALLGITDSSLPPPDSCLLFVMLDSSYPQLPTHKTKLVYRLS